MRPNADPRGREESKSIDLLVDGALSEADRRALLLGLDDSPGGWKRCALAFLEARTWREAFGEAARVEPLAYRPSPRRVAPWMAMAATAMVAFGAGWMTRSPGTSRSLAAVPPPAPPVQQLLPPMPPVPALAMPEPVRPAPSPANYAQGRLEREGFQIERQRLIVPARTRDGRPVVVPLQRTTVRYVGNRSA